MIACWEGRFIARQLELMFTISDTNVRTSGMVSAEKRFNFFEPIKKDALFPPYLISPRLTPCGMKDDPFKNNLMKTVKLAQRHIMVMSVD